MRFRFVCLPTLSKHCRIISSFVMKPVLLPLLLFVLTRVGAQQPISVVPLTTAINFDGIPDEAAWQSTTRLHYKMQIPNYGQPPSERSDIFLTFDKDYLYLAGRLYLSDPSFYRPTTYKRDAFDGTTDYFGLLIDSYLDKENAVAFFTTPTGLRWDGTIANDALTNADISIDWNTFFDVAVARDDEGWSAEMRIPWSSLRFQTIEGAVVMGITSWWYIAAKNEVDMYPLIPLNWGQNSGWKPSQMQEYRFEGVEPQKPLYLAPYLLGGFQQNYELNETETHYDKVDEPTFEAGLDVKYGITSNLTLDVTVNTDFAQVEADDQQVNLTRFSLFFPEKRLFFQERASIFNFNFEGFNRLFYSRSIGINDDGDPVRIFGGTRLVGRLGKFDLGLLNIQTQKNGDLNSENFGLLRLRRQILNTNSYIGGIFTNRTDLDGQYNATYGLDGIFRIAGDDYLTVKWAQVFENSTANELASLTASRLYINWERRRLFDGLGYNLTFSRSGKDYNPGLGFELRNNFVNGQATLGYGWLMDEEAKLLQLRTWVEGRALRNIETDTVETAAALAGIELQTKTGWGAIVSAGLYHEYVPEAFDLSDEVTIENGEYDFFQIQGFINAPYGGYVGAFGDFTVGEFYGGQLISVGITPRVKTSAHLDLEGYYQINRAKFDNRGLTFVAHIGRLKALYMLNTKFSIAAFLQYNSLDELFAGNIRLRYNPKEGNDLYIVYNDLLNNDRHRESPHLPFSSSRTIVLKYTYTFRI